MKLVFRSPSDDPALWRAICTRLMPALDFRVWPETGDPAEIDGALVWRPPAGWLATFPNLKWIQSLGAGVDHILNDPALPKHVPVIRMIDPAMATAMTEYVLFQVLRLHLRDFDYRHQQRTRRWQPLPQPIAAHRRVGVLGLGSLGCHAAARLRDAGFDVAGWSRTRKDIPGVASFAGRSEWSEFLARTEILVCLLPLTAETRGILNADALSRLPRGAGLVNAGRGSHLVEADLIAALDTGHLSAAVLDVVAEEPPPPDHPFWNHPRVILTPHAAAQTDPATAAAVAVANLRLLAAGRPVSGIVDRAAGY